MPATVLTKHMPSAISTANAIETAREETVRLVIVRLLWIASVTIFAWCVIAAMVYLTPFPAMPVDSEAEPAATPILSIRFAGAILIAHFVSVLVVQVLAPRAVIKSRLVSNTMFSGLLLSLCGAISLVGQIVPPESVPYLKGALAIAFKPAFVIANFLLCSVAGILIYWARETGLADVVEIYWSLGLMFLFGLAIALVTAVVAI